MRKLCFAVTICGIVLAGSVFAAEKLSDFKVKALDVIEKTRPAVQSAAFKRLQDSFKEKQVAVRFLAKGAYTSKFVNPKDKKEYLLTAVPMVSYFPTAAPPLAALIISNGEEFRAGWLDVSKDRRGRLICRLLTSVDQVAQAEKVEMLEKTSLPLPRGEAAIAIAKNPEGDDVILVLCRSPYAAKKEGEMECLAVIFYSGDLAWEKFVSAAKAKGG